MTEQIKICFPISLWQWSILVFFCLLLSVCVWPAFFFFSSSSSSVLSSVCLVLVFLFYLSVFFLLCFYWFLFFFSLFFLLTFYFFGTPLCSLLVSFCSSRFFLSCSLCCPCLWCIGTTGSQSECNQSGAGGQHPAGERCSEDKPSCSRTGNKPREHHLEGKPPKQCSLD